MRLRHSQTPDWRGMTGDEAPLCSILSGKLGKNEDDLGRGGGPGVMCRWRSLWWEEGPDGVLGINWPRRLDIWVWI